MTVPPNDERGFALFLTVAFVGLLAAATLNFNVSMRGELTSAVSFRDGHRLKAAARSGVDLAMAVLHEKALAGGPHSLLDHWADSVSMTSLLESMFEDISAELIVSDVSGKINVNSLTSAAGAVNRRYRDLMARFLSFEDFGLEADEIEDILDALAERLGRDGEASPCRAQNYRCFGMPGPMRCVSDLLAVRGITPGVFHGTDHSPGIASFLTVHGEGPVNINTAHPIVLRSLSSVMDFHMAGRMADYRENESADLSDPAWYRHVPGMKDVRLEPAVASIFSSHFEIFSAVGNGGRPVEVSAVVRKSAGSVSIVSWKTGENF